MKAEHKSYDIIKTLNSTNNSITFDISKNSITIYSGTQVEKE